MLQAPFGQKWACDDADAHERIDVLFRGLGPHPLQWTPESVARAVAALRRPELVDPSGVCGSARQLLADATPEDVARSANLGCGPGVSV